jgi:hypothetical protein
MRLPATAYREASFIGLAAKKVAADPQTAKLPDRPVPEMKPRPYEFHVLLGLVSVVPMFIASIAAYGLQNFRRVAQESRHSELRTCVIVYLTRFRE